MCVQSCYMQQNNVVVIRRGNLLDMILALFFVWKSGLPRESDTDFPRYGPVQILVAYEADYSLLGIEEIYIPQSCVVVPGMLIGQVLEEIPTDPELMRFWFAVHDHCAFVDFLADDLEEIQHCAAIQSVLFRSKNAMREDTVGADPVYGIVEFLMKGEDTKIPDWMVALIDNTFVLLQQSKKAEIAFLVARYREQLGIADNAMDPFES